MKILKNFLFGAVAVILGMALWSCNDDVDDLEARVDSLEGRVSSLESQVSTLNSNIETLFNLLNTATIYSITESNGVITITASNGDTFTITQGGEGTQGAQGEAGNTPLLSVDENGYWIVSYDNGATYEQMLVNGEPVLAASVCPQFSVDNNGYWLVSYDDGKTFSQVLDSNGNPVNAVGSGSSLFKDVSYNESTGILTIVLADGYSLEIAVVPDFFCSFVGVDYDTPVPFTLGKTREIPVTMRGVAAAFVVVPEGWSATLGNPVDETATLTLTAPSDFTKAMANTDTDVSIMAVSDKGYSAIAKMQVELSEDEPVPAVTVAFESATGSSLSFTVTPNSDVTSWKYEILPASEAAPASEDDFADAETSTETVATTIELTGLTAETEYVLYVLPINEVFGDVTYGDIVSATGTTLAKDTYYTRFLAGEDITIAGTKVNISSYDSPILIDEDTNIDNLETTARNIIFVDPGLDVNYTFTNGFNNLVIIGNDPEQMSTVKSSIQIKFAKNNWNGAILMLNINLDLSELDNYPFVNNGGGDPLEIFAFDHCRVVLPTLASANSKLYYNNSADRYIKTIIFDDCLWVVPPSSSAEYFFQFGDAVVQEFTKFSFTNNVFYATEGIVEIRFVRAHYATIDEFVFENNTLINIRFSDNSTVRYAKLKDISMQNNLFYGTSSSSVMNRFFHENTEAAPENNPTGTIVSHNGVYNWTDWKWFQDATTVDTSGYTVYEECTTLAGDPFVGGTLDFDTETFIPASAYSDYGAQ